MSSPAVERHPRRKPGSQSHGATVAVEAAMPAGLPVGLLAGPRSKPTVGRSAARVGESNAGCQSGDPNAHPGTEYWKWPRLNGSSA